VISPAQQRVYRESIARHEAGHATCYIAAGLFPERVEVVVNEHEAHGTTTLAEADRTGVKALWALMALLAGPMAEHGRPPSWPLIRGTSPDEDQILDLVEWLGVGRKGYEAVVRAMYQVIADAEYMALEGALAYALEHCTPVIDQAGIERIADIVARHQEEED
jgi:hypothetical protein